MNIRTAATAVLTYIAVGATSVAIAQTTWPQLTKGDLEACRSVVSQAHKKEFAWYDDQIQMYCTSGGRFYDAQDCASERKWLAETKAQDDVAWYFKGNEHCEGSDYPCFGPGLFNDARTGEEATYWSQRFAEMAAEGSTITPAMDFNEAAFKSDNCLAAVWVKKAKAAGLKATPVAQPAPQPTPQPAPKATPAPAPKEISASDPGFQSNLKTYPADQLLALTNELVSTGQIDLAKLARNALLQRFPDSPLVPLVAQLIANASKPGAPAATPAPSPAPAANIQQAQAASGQRLYINNLSQMISAFARFGVALNPVTGSTTEAQEGGNLFSAYLSDCRSDGQCWGLQLQARYAFSPMPTPDLVQSWNINKLYGRAYIANDRANFDMVLRIPQDGVDPKTLEDFVTLFKDASNAFYNLVKPQ
ncbi:MAG: YbjN domain-containing protein [Hyphomonadaceae bacterium]